MADDEGGSGGLGKVFGKGSTAEQFLIWGVLQQIIQPLLAPLTTELGKLVYSAAPDVPLTPADAAALVARGLIDHGTGQDIANDSGIGGSDFDKLVNAAGHGPDLGAVIAAYQRGYIGAGGDQGDDVSLTGALKDLGVRDGWHDIVQKLTVQIPTVAEVMNAWLEGQISEGEARTRYLAAGGDPTWFQTSYNANGTAPTPMEALELLNRGIIPEGGTGPDSVSYTQAFLEGPWRNKWLGPFLALREYLPPPRTVTAMFHEGQLDHATALDLLVKQGLTSTLAAAYLAPKASTASSTDKVLAKTDILAAYADGIMSHDDALAALVKLKYSQHDAALILRLQDVRTATKQTAAGVSRTRALYNAGKISRADAQHALAALGVSADQAKAMVDVWSVTDLPPVRTLSEAQVTAAWQIGLITAEDAMARLETLGYDAIDAWLLLSIRAKGPVADLPRPAGG